MESDTSLNVPDCEWDTEIDIDTEDMSDAEMDNIISTISETFVMEEEDIQLPEELNLIEELQNLYIKEPTLKFQCNVNNLLDYLLKNKYLVEIFCSCQWKQICLFYDKHVNVQDSGVAQSCFLSFHKE